MKVIQQITKYLWSQGVVTIVIAWQTSALHAQPVAKSAGARTGAAAPILRTQPAIRPEAMSNSQIRHAARFYSGPEIRAAIQPFVFFCDEQTGITAP